MSGHDSAAGRPAAIRRLAPGAVWRTGIASADKLLRSRPRVDRPIREPANSAEWYAGVPNSADAPIFALSNCSAARLADLPRERAFEVVC